MKSLLLLILLMITTVANPQGRLYGNAKANLDGSLSKLLAEHYVPKGNGAMGRNRRDYFHVRFQLGIHHLADYGIVTKQLQPIHYFLNATEYSFRYQLEGGDFSLVIPANMKNEGVPSIADRASAVAFFASSLGSGIYALDTNNWFLQSAECEPFRARLAAIKEKLSNTLLYLSKHREHLESADRNAPNRLLFDGLAFYTLGKILQNDKAIEVASSFIKSALQQVHEDGYFIEGGGFDSSYNGVAVALGFRLLLMGYSEDKLDAVSRKAILWQKGRIAATGEITTDGNSRVNPNEQGESFLGQVKEVDVVHTIEAFMLASQYTSDEKYALLATEVLSYYQQRK